MTTVERITFAAVAALSAGTGMYALQWLAKVAARSFRRSR